MAFFDQTARTPAAAGGSFLADIRAAVQRYRVMRRTYGELSSLNDRELEDLGIARADIARIARESAGYRY